jgi:hypothetical protein
MRIMKPEPSEAVRRICLTGARLRLLVALWDVKKALAEQPRKTEAVRCAELVFEELCDCRMYVVKRDTDSMQHVANLRPVDRALIDDLEHAVRMLRRVEQGEGAGADRDQSGTGQGEGGKPLTRRSKPATRGKATPAQTADDSTAINASSPLSARDLAGMLGKSAMAVESFLRRYRNKYPDCYITVDDEERRRNTPKYLYHVADVMPLLRSHFAEKPNLTDR